MLSSVIGAALLWAGLLPKQPTERDVWQARLPDAERHPCVLFSPDDLPAIRERLERQPYASWWSGVQSSQNMVAQAFTWNITGDEEKAEAVRRQLLRCNPTGYHCCCGVADALQGVAEAYDLIYNYPGVTETEHRVIRAKIAHACERLYLSALESGAGQHPGNQRTRGICALGTAAIVLSGYRDSTHTPLEWLQRALDGIHQDVNLAFWRDDGMFIEGPGYSSFTLSMMLPFARYYERASGNWLFDDPRLRNALQYLVYITQPDGYAAAIGTTNMCNVVNCLKLCVGAGRPEDQAAFRWALDEWGSLSGGGVRELCLFDDSVEPSISSLSTSRFFPVSQEASLRSEWSRNAVALWFKGKDPWLARTYRVYSHGDVASFVLHAYGELLAVDAGYDHWVSYDLYPPELHNTLLVDGQGPASETPGALENIIDADFVRSADVVTEYAGVKLRRTFLLVEDEFVVIVDDVQADAEHVYEWLIHTPVSRATGEVEVEGNRASWTGFDPRADTPGKVALDVYWAGPVEVEAVEESRWQPWSADPKTGSHDNWAVVARQRGQNVKFLTVLYPRLAEARPSPALRPDVGERWSVSVPGAPEGGTVVRVADDRADTPEQERATARITLMRWVSALNWVYVAGPGRALERSWPLLEVSDSGGAAMRVPAKGLPARVHVSGPAGMTVAGQARERGPAPRFLWADSGRVAEPPGVPGNEWSLNLSEAVPGPASVVSLPEGPDPVQDASPPRVAGVWIDGEPAETAELIDLGRVDPPPQHLRVQFNDEGAGLHTSSARLRLNGRGYYRRMAADGTIEYPFGRLEEPIEYELAIRVADQALLPNSTQFTLRFSMLPLLGNGGFERGGEHPDGWSLGAWSRNEDTQYDIRTVTDDPHSGARCLKMEGIAGALNLCASQAVKLQVGQTYVLTGHYRGAVAARASLCSADGKGQYIFSPDIGPSAEWAPFRWEFTVENPAPTLLIALRLGSVGSVFLDDVMLERLP